MDTENTGNFTISDEGTTKYKKSLSKFMAGKTKSWTCDYYEWKHLTESSLVKGSRNKPQWGSKVSSWEKFSKKFPGFKFVFVLQDEKCHVSSFDNPDVVYVFTTIYDLKSKIHRTIDNGSILLKIELLSFCSQEQLKEIREKVSKLDIALDKVIHGV